jgi:hypothetical protein
VANIRTEVTTPVLPTTKQERCPLGFDKTEVVDEATVLLVCDNASLGISSPTFRYNVVVTYSVFTRFNCSLDLDELTGYHGLLETSGTKRPFTRRRILEDLMRHPDIIFNTLEFISLYLRTNYLGAWGSVVVKALRY